MNNNLNSGTITLPALLGTAFIVLKLTGVITWSWLWVLSPFWIPFVIFALFLLILVIVAKTK